MTKENEIGWVLIVAVSLTFLLGIIAQYKFNMYLGERYLECPWCGNVLKYKESRRAFDANQHPPGYCNPPIPDWNPEAWETVDGYQSGNYIKPVRIRK